MHLHGALAIDHMKRDAVRSVQFILYVGDQQRSRDFYAQLLRKAPVLDVPGMTEFQLTAEVKLGLMPAEGIARIISGVLPHPEKGAGIPRCELYLHVDDLDLECTNALRCGALSVDEKADRDWGDTVAYFADPDGHVIAFAERTGER